MLKILEENRYVTIFMTLLWIWFHFDSVVDPCLKIKTCTVSCKLLEAYSYSFGRCVHLMEGRTLAYQIAWISVQLLWYTVNIGINWSIFDPFINNPHGFNDSGSWRWNFSSFYMDAWHTIKKWFNVP